MKKKIVKKTKMPKPPKGLMPAMPVDQAPQFGGKKKPNMADVMLNKLSK